MCLKIIKKIFLLSVFFLLCLITWFSLEFYSLPKIDPKSVILEIEPGKNVREIAGKLHQKRIIQKKWPFLVGYLLFFSSQSVKAGEYKLELPLSPKSILEKLTKGEIYLHPVTIPEGLTIQETALLFHSTLSIKPQQFIQAAHNTQLISSLDPKAKDLEGYLYPETYHFPDGTSASKVISTMVSQFKEVFNSKWRKKAQQINMTIREVVTLASMVEKETGISEEKPLISAVFHNRLQKGMKLDCDPTIIYVLKKENKFRGQLWIKHLKLDSPYNTYVYSGLPPGPIANPGKEALQAALYPADVSYLYFVSKNDGTHHFSRTFKEHQRAVNKYQR